MSTQTEALRIANEYRPTMGIDIVRLWAPDAVAALQRQHAEIEALQAKIDSLMQAIEHLLDAGHMNQEHLARLRAAWEAA